MKNEFPKILVVDDDYNSFFLIKELLSNYNIDVLYASSGIDAIDQCKKDSTISLIFMDIKMKGINGVETALHIKDFRKDTPIIFQTAYAKDFAKDIFMKSIGNGFLEKPIKKDVLINEVKKHMNINININHVSNKIEPGFSFRNVFSLIFS